MDTNLELTDMLALTRGDPGETIHTELNGRISKDDQYEVKVTSRDFLVPRMTQIGNSIDEICKHFQYTVPHNLPSSLKKVRQYILSYVRSYLQRPDPDGLVQDPFVFLDKSLAIHLADDLHSDTDDHVCDVFIALPNHPSMVLTIVKGENTRLRQYNVAVARNLRMAMNSFVDENYNPVFGTIPNEDLSNVASLDTRIKCIVQYSSRFVTRDSLSMSRSKYNKVQKSFLMCIAKVQSGALNDGETTMIHFLTKDQCVTIVEFINSKKVHVKTKSKSGATVLMLEVTKRLQRTGTTCLHFRLESDAEKYRHLNFEAEAWLNPQHLITDRFVSEETRTSVPGNVWMFTAEFLPTQALAKEIDEIMVHQFLIVVGSPGDGKSVLLQMMLDHFKNKGIKVLPLKDVSTLKGNEETIVFADDIFGKHSYTFHFTVEFEKFLESLRANAHVRFLCTSRDDLYNLGLPQLGKYQSLFQGQNKTDLGKWNENDRRTILEKYTKEEEINLPDIIREGIIKSTKSKGFPLSCHLFATTHKTQSDMDPVSFFENPVEHMKSFISIHLRNDATKVLLYLLVSCDGTFHFERLCHSDSDEAQRFCEVKSHLCIQDMSIVPRMRVAVHKLTIGLLKNTENRLSFYHPLLYEITASVIAENDLDFIVRYAPLVFFTLSDKQCMVTLPQNRFNAIAKRLSEKLEEGDISYYQSILLQNELFVEEVCRQLSKCLAHDQHKRSEIMYWAASCRKSKLLIKIITKYLEDAEAVQSAIKGCCRWNDVPSLMCILKEINLATIDINIITENGLPCFIVAANLNHVSVVEILLKSNVDINITENCTGGTALHWAAAAGHLYVVQKLLGAGIAVDKENNGGATALFLSASNGHTDVVMQLVEHGANINRQISSRMISLQDRRIERRAVVQNMHCSDKGFAPLHVASLEGHVETVQCLLKHNADPSVESTQGTPVTLAAKSNQLEIFNILILDKRTDREVALTAAFEFGRIPMLEKLLSLESSSEKDLLKHAFEGNVGKLDTKDLRSFEVDITGFTALHLASVAGRYQVVQLLLSRGMHVNRSSQRNLTALHGAAINGHTSILEQLLEAGAKVHVQTDSGYNALHYAAMHGHHNAVRILVSKGANVDATGFRQWTSLHLACNEGHLDVVKSLLDNGANKELLTDNFGTPLLFAAYESNLKIVDYMLDKGAVLNPHGEVFPPLLGATIASNRPSIYHLLKKGANVNHVSGMGIAAIHGAAMMGSLDIVMELVNAGADVNIKLFSGMKEENKKKVFQHILTWGKTTPGREIPVAIYDQGTPLHIAAYLGHADIGEALLIHGAIRNVRNINGHTPLDIAEKMGHKETVALLKCPSFTV